MDNPFTTLGLPEQFDLDPNAIETAYLIKAAEAHPDRFNDPLQQAEAAEQSSAINEARDILKNPERRARALLTLRGETEAGNQEALPPDFLMDVMDVRERLETAMENQNDTELAKLREWAQTSRKEHLQKLKTQFKQNSPTDKIRQELNTLRYIQRMLDQMPG